MHITPVWALPWWIKSVNMSNLKLSLQIKKQVKAPHAGPNSWWILGLPLWIHQQQVVILWHLPKSHKNSHTSSLGMMILKAWFHLTNHLTKESSTYGRRNNEGWQEFRIQSQILQSQRFPRFQSQLTKRIQSRIYSSTCNASQLTMEARVNKIRPRWFPSIASPWWKVSRDSSRSSA